MLYFQQHFYLQADLKNIYLFIEAVVFKSLIVEFDRSGIYHFIHSKRTCGWFLLCIINKFLFRSNIFCVNQAVFHTEMTFEVFICSWYIFELGWYREIMFSFIKPIDSEISINNKCYRKKQPEKKSLLWHLLENIAALLFQLWSKFKFNNWSGLTICPIGFFFGLNDLSHCKISFSI